MTVLLVLFTLIIFLVFDHFVQRHRARSAQSVLGSVERGNAFGDFPQEMALATNHTWLRNNPDGTTTIGMDEFLSRLVGAVEKITLLRPGERIAPAGAGIGVQSGGRALRLAIPLNGEVVSANPDVLQDPSVVLRDPYGKGWLMRVRSHSDAAHKMQDFLVVHPAEWLAEQAALLRDFFAAHSPQPRGMVLQEGGVPVEGVMQQFDAGVWEEFGRSFAALRTVEDTRLEEARS